MQIVHFMLNNIIFMNYQKVKNITKIQMCLYVLTMDLHKLKFFYINLEKLIKIHNLFLKIVIQIFL